ncbi:MAG: peptidylprolyl isomerase [Candidatus Acidiferrales bacterium]
MITTRIEELFLAAACLSGAALFGREAHKRREGQKPSPEAENAGHPPAGEDAATPPVKLDQPPGLYAVFETTLGRIVCRLFPEKAPVTVKNFVELAQGAKKWHNAAEKQWEDRPYYNGLTFHRVIPKFMIQGGDYMGNGTGGVGFTFEDEFAPGVTFNRPGLLAMANAGPNTNGAQFFITVEATPWLDRKHSIFGEVAEGQDVADAICNTPRDVRDRPLKPVIVRRVAIVDTRASAAQG